MTTIVNIKSGAKYDIYIGRANKTYNVEQSKWANPFIIGRDGDRFEVIDKYYNWLILQKPDLLKDLQEIDGKILACWCDYPNEDCHGRVLIELREKQILEQSIKKCLCIIAGSRHLYNYGLVVDVIKESGFKIDEIVCGCAKGVDSNGRIYGEKNNIPVKKFPAKWDDFTVKPCVIKTRYDGAKYNSWAGHIRNKEMAEYATHLILIHSNTSGSLSMKKLAKEKGLIIYEKVVND
jgi:Domain of unknown function (DUF4326)